MLMCLFGGFLDINFVASRIEVCVLVLSWGKDQRRLALLELKRTGLWGLTSYLLFVGWLARQTDIQGIKATDEPTPIYDFFKS